MRRRCSHEEVIGCDMHKKFSAFVAMDENGYLEPARKVVNDPLELRGYLGVLASINPRKASQSWWQWCGRHWLSTSPVSVFRAANSVVVP